MSSSSKSDPTTVLTVEEATEALTKAAFTVTDPDMSDCGRTLIHCQIGSFGADWDLDAAIALLADARSIEWRWNLLRHDLCVVGADGKAHYFGVEWPERNASEPAPTKVVPADAIVLERPTAEDDEDLAGYLGIELDLAVGVNVDGHVTFGGGDETGDAFELVLNRAQVRSLCARLVLAADEAERGQG